MSLEESRYFSILIIGAVMVISGLLMLLFAKKEVNIVFGYRTPSSMKSPERFYFAQVYCGRLMIFLGILSTLFTIYGYLFLPNLLKEKHVITLFSIGLAITIFVFTEIAIHRKFKKGT